MRSLLEMYFDRGEEFGRPGELPGDDTDRFLEYWNHVFMTYDLAEDGTLTELPMKNIDTGMGVERMAAILQGVDSVFETDSLRPLIELAEELSGRSYSDGGATTRAMRILADHARGTAALIADGVVPSNEDRGYVLRRIMRRAIQQGRSIGLPSPFLERFADRALDLSSPHSRSSLPSAATWCAGRRTRRRASTYARARDPDTGRPGAPCPRGPDLLDRRGGRVPAPRHLRLPLRPAKELLAEQGLSVDDEGFEELMEEQRARARMGTATAHGSEDHHGAVLSFASAAPPTRFVGYEKLRAETSLLAAEGDDGRALVKLEESPFYAEGGGQVADSGELRWDGGSAPVADVYRIGDDQAVELGSPLDDLGAGTRVEAEVDHVARFATMRNHTATHLLHAALKERLGTHVRQAGSAVRPTSSASTSPTALR